MFDLVPLLALVYSFFFVDIHICIPNVVTYFLIFIRLKCETPRKSNFLKKGEMVISIKIHNFSRSRVMKRTSPFELSREI